MKIYVMGNLEQARAMLAHHQPAQPLNHCPETLQGGHAVITTETPDWIVIEGHALSREGMALIQSLRAMDFSSYPHEPRRYGTVIPSWREAADSHPETGTHASSPRGASGSARRGGRGPQRTGTALVYEFRAPSRRRNN